MAGCVIAPASLFVHAYMLDWMHVPYPSTPGLPVWVSVVALAMRLASLAVVVRLAVPAPPRRSPLVLACAFGVLILALNETLRVVFIVGALTESLPYGIVDRAPGAISTFLEVAVVAYATLRGLTVRRLLVVSVLTAVFAAGFVSPWLTDQLGRWRDVHFSGIVQHYRDPYPAKIEAVIYAGSVEPMLAVFGLAAVTWRRLGVGAVQRIASFVLLLLILRGRMVSLLLESFWVRQPLPVALLAEGQFFAETLILALLVGMAWAWLSPVERAARSTEHLPPGRD